LNKAAQIVAGILFHSFIMTSSCWMLDIGHMALLLPLEGKPQVLNSF